MKVSLVAAMDLGGGIGKGGQIPWRLPRDLRRFRDLSMGKPVLMGRNTYASMGKPLKGRETIVLSRDPSFSAPGCRVARSVDEGLRLAEGLGATEAVVAGGGPVYRDSLRLADELRLTLVMGVFDADAHFPRDWADFGPWAVTTEAYFPPDQDHPLAHLFFTASRPAGGAPRVGV